MTEHRSLIDRPLTDRQREVLRCVAEGRCHMSPLRIGGRTFHIWFAYGREASPQVAALHKRDFIRMRVNAGTAKLTLAGAFELYLDASKLCHCQGSRVEMVDYGNGNVLDIDCSYCTPSLLAGL